MNFIQNILLSILMMLFLVACSASEPKLDPADILDNDTGKIYSLGMPKEDFDNAFNSTTITEDGDTTDYLSGVLSVTYVNGMAVEIECRGRSNRFSFYNFDFSMDISEIEGRYEKNDNVSGYIFYSRYYDSDGNDVSLSNSEITARLMVRNGDMLDMKDGQYIQYSIESVSQLPQAQSDISTSSSDDQTAKDISNNQTGEQNNDENVKTLLENIFQLSIPMLIDAEDGEATVILSDDSIADLYGKALNGDKKSAEDWDTLVSNLLTLHNEARKQIERQGDYTLSTIFASETNSFPYIAIDNGEITVNMLHMGE